jgi:1,4-dihydroxy-2-naphthoyl-CoA synthase
MTFQMIKYAKNDAIATITLNRPEKYNTLRSEMIRELDNALMDANQDDGIKVIVLKGAGDSFCGGFDFSGGLEHFDHIKEEDYDNMGLQSTQTLGPILDGAMRNTPEGREFVRVSMADGVKAAVEKRDGSFNDYSQGPRKDQPRKRSELD